MIENVAIPGLAIREPRPPQPPPVRRMTERAVLDLLHERYSQSVGATNRYVCAEHIRSHASYDARRICDFMAQDLWHAGHLQLHGHEVKVSRSDWLRELADPSKAEAFARFCDRWWLVVSDAAIVRDDLPSGWGLMAPDKTGRLKVRRPAKVLTHEPLTVTFRASLMRAVSKTATRRAERGAP